jgi:secondary thiamine-phosphate synthase enzyme
MISELTVQSRQREQMIDVTAMVEEVLARTGSVSGVLLCFVPHTTAGITINENADPDVKRDILQKLQREIPQNDGYAHAEGNSDAHLKSSLMGFSIQVPFENGSLVLGRWQGIFFCEFDGPRSRRLIVRVIPLA